MDIERITPEQARDRQAAGTLLIDVRSAAERAAGHAQHSIGVPRELLEADPAAIIPSLDSPVMLICERGGRSMEAATALSARGYVRIASVDGGTARWLEEGLPAVRPTGDEADFHERYARHLRLPDVGLDGQRRLRAARVTVIGAGGLGSPVAFYLTAAGVGHLRLVDDDVVERSNLQRQILHTDAGIGRAKVDSARQALAALNPGVQVEAVRERVDASNAARLVADADVVVDGADNFAVRYVLNDACLALGKPLVYGAVHRFDGQVSVFDAGRRRGRAPCYRCLFPEPPPPDAAPNCSEAGVLGVLPGVIGLLQATEAIKLILGIGESLAGRLLSFDALAMRFRETRLAVDPQCPGCSADAEPAAPVPGGPACVSR